MLLKEKYKNFEDIFANNRETKRDCDSFMVEMLYHIAVSLEDINETLKQVTKKINH